MATETIKFEDAKTVAEINKYLGQECTSSGLLTSFYTYVGGMIGVPLLFKKFHDRIPIPREYKWSLCAISMMVFSYSSGAYVKRRCEENVKKQLQARLLA